MKKIVFTLLFSSSFVLAQSDKQDHVEKVIQQVKNMPQETISMKKVAQIKNILDEVPDKIVAFGTLSSAQLEAKLTELKIYICLYLLFFKKQNHTTIFIKLNTIVDEINSYLHWREEAAQDQISLAASYFEQHKEEWLSEIKNQLILIKF